MTKPINLRFKVSRFIAITLGILSISFAPFFFAPGLENPEPIGTFLNQQFPADPPSSSPYRVAFPNITFNTPTTFSYLPIVDKFMVGQREGSLHWFDNNETTTQKNLLINLSDEVGEVWDGGLLGAAVHPEFGLNNNNYIYIWFTTEDSLGREYPDFPGNYNCFSEDYWGNFLKLVRFEIDVNDISIVPNSRLDMMVLRMYGTTHRGGGMVFGDDGFLYLTTGDQTGASKAQDIVDNLDGGVLRLDVNQDPTKSHPPTRLMPDDAGEIDEVSGVGYWIPNDNPFISVTGDNFEEYYTLGHRNPFRLTKDQLTGELFIGEVGRSTHEEINVVVKGENYGWPVFEGYADGLNCVPMYDDMTQKGPLVAFPRSEMNAIIGGYVYRGTENPALYGKYLCADYGDGEEIYAVDPQTGSYEFISNFLPENVIGFGENPNGELYIMQFGNDTHLYQIVPSATNAINVPQKLSETGAFADLNTLTPTQGLIPYELIESFWSDGAEKKRWMAIPNDGTHNTPEEQIKFSENGVWDFPIGTVLVKHFEMPIDENNPSVTKRLETRFSVKANDGNFYFLTYKWNNAETDADLLSFGLDEQININLASGGTKTINWRYPSNSECISCHNNTSKGSLGPRTRYLNSDYTYPQTGDTGNQLITLSHLGILDENIDASDVSSYLTYKAIDDQNATLDEKARSYLDLNCAYCHQPGTGNRAQFDLRLPNTLQETILLTSGVNTSLGIEGEAIIVPGDASKSILYHRMNSTQPGIAMPPLAKGQIHDEAVSLINDWINQLDENSDNGLCQNSTNLALNKVASQSSTYANGVASIAVDGNTVGTSPWDADLQHTVSGQSQPWWQVDLGSQNQIEQIIIYNRTDKLQGRLNNFHVFISSNPFDVNASLQDLINNNSITDIFYEGEAELQETFGVIADGRYVRIQLSGENESLHMAEVMVMGCDADSNDLCAGIDAPIINTVGPFTTNDDIQTLTANPEGGIWSGDSNDGTFNPATLGEGTYTITYTMDNGAGCIQSDTITIDINNACDNTSDIVIDPAGPFTTDAGIQILTALPIGGVWSGDSTNGNFDPSVGEGTYSVTYTVDFGNGCTKDDTITITVEADSTGNGECTSTINVALDGTASQSSTYGFGEASYAIDGNNTGTSPWDADLQHTVSGENESWWQVDLGEENVIEEIVIFNRTDKLQARLNNFYVLVSENPFDENASLQNLLDDNAITNQFFAGNAGLQENIPITANGRYVRIQLSSNNGTLHMAEVMVMGCEDTTPDPCAGTEDVVIDPTGPFTTTDGIQTLIANPEGGVWSGDSTDGTFNPSVGEGTYSVTYTVDFGNDCIKEDTIDIIISDTVDPCLGTEDVTIDQAGPFADDAGIQTLTALPLGGVWSGDSTDGNFDPSVGEGTYSATYTVDFGNGCTKDETITITVEADSTGNGECTSTTNLALGGTASQSSTYGFGEASYAIDGNTTGTSPWDADLQHTVSGENESWWQVDLGDENVIEEIVIYNRTDKLQARLNNFYVLVSENAFDENASLQNLLDDGAITNQFFAGNAGLQENISITANGRYVRIQLSSNNGTLHMAEVMVMGCEDTTPDPCAGTEDVVIDPTGPFTTTDGIQTLIANPEGGVWSGDSTDGTFNPSVGEGTYSVTYTVDFGNDCIKEDTIDIIISDTVDPCLGTEDVTIDQAGPFAVDAGIQILTALPLGGVWSGDSTNGNFDPSVGEGTYSVTYTVDFGNGCTKDDTITITVEADSTGNGECTSTINVALDGTASQSSTYGFGEASYAIDGNNTGTSPWDADLQHTVSGENESWWQVDLGEENVIEEIVIFNRTDKLQARLNNFYVLVSGNPFDENASLQNLLDDNAITNQFFAGNAGLQENIPITANGRYVRIQLSSNNGTLHMAEVMVMGCDSQVQPLLSDLDNIMNGISSSDEARLAEQKITMYPIPSQGLINLYLGNFMNQKVAIEIFNTNGQKVFTKDYKSTHYALEELELQSLSEGVYQMSITSDQFFEIKPFMLLNKR